MDFAAAFAADVALRMTKCLKEGQRVRRRRQRQTAKVAGGNNQKKDRASPSLSPFLSAGNRGGREGEKRERRRLRWKEGGYYRPNSNCSPDSKQRREGEREGEREEVPRWSQHESLDSKRKGEEIAPCCCSIAAHHCWERESESRDRRCMIRAH